MIQQITPLPTPPQPGDSPADFDQKAFSLLGGLPQFVTEANALGVQIFDTGEAAEASASSANASKNAAATSASNSADHASAALTSASNAANSANLANQSRIDAQAAAGTAETIASGMENAIAFANTFTSVPATNQGPMVVVTQPHLRFMVWDGVKYVRAPWHRPGLIFHSDGDPAKITHGIQMRSDVVYNTSDYPDLAEFYGAVGTTFVLNDARARVIRGSDLGRGIDSALVNGYLQEDAIRNITGVLGAAGAGVFGISSSSGVFAAGIDFGQYATPQIGSGSAIATIDASRQVPTASENRVKSLVATHYVTI